jgi:hypothetical protein
MYFKKKIKDDYSGKFAKFSEKMQSGVSYRGHTEKFVSIVYENLSNSEEFLDSGYLDSQILKIA